MADREFYLGSVGPLLVDDASPVFTDPGQVVQRQDVSALIADDIATAITNHKAESDPHPTYLTATEGNAAYTPLSHASATNNPHSVTLEQARTAGSNMTGLFSCGSKGAMTPEGGFAVKLTNKTGAASVKGTVVCASATTDKAVEKVVVDVPDAFGIIYEDGVADGSEVWVVIAGLAEVYFVGSTTRKHLARTFITADGGSYVSGQALSEAFPAAPFATDKHFCELGHVLESRTGAGLALVNLHWN